MKTKFGQNSFAYRGATIWNSLPNDCRTTHTFATFKVKLKPCSHSTIYFSFQFKYKFCKTFSIFFAILYYCILAVYIFFLLKEGPLKTSYAEG